VNVDRKFERSEFEKLFLSAVEETKKKLVYRKLASELAVKSSKAQHKSQNELDDALE
jgi:hypothetical protein